MLNTIDDYLPTLSLLGVLLLTIHIKPIFSQFTFWQKLGFYLILIGVVGDAVISFTQGFIQGMAG